MKSTTLTVFFSLLTSSSSNHYIFMILAMI